MRLTTTSIANFIYHTYKIEDLKIVSIPEIKNFMKHTTSAEKTGLPSLLNNSQVSAHLRAIEYVRIHKNKKPRIQDIVNLQEILIGPFDDRLTFRTGPLMVGKRRAPDSRFIADMFMFWLDTWDKVCYKSYSKKVLCKLRHAEFEYIHPFPMGNGVIGRIILLWDCLYHKTKMDIITDQPAYFEYLNNYIVDRDRILAKW